MTADIVTLVVVAVDIVPLGTIASPVEVEDNFIVAIFTGLENQAVG